MEAAYRWDQVVYWGTYKAWLKSTNIWRGIAPPQSKVLLYRRCSTLRQQQTIFPWRSTDWALQNTLVLVLFNLLMTWGEIGQLHKEWWLVLVYLCICNCSKQDWFKALFIVDTTCKMQWYNCLKSPQKTLVSLNDNSATHTSTHKLYLWSTIYSQPTHGKRWIL